jgi:hypothetical protein
MTMTKTGGHLQATVGDAVDDHAHAASGQSLICNNAQRRLLIGCPEDRDPGVDLAQAGTCRDQHAIGRQRAQLGGMSVEGGTLGVGHGGDEVIARRVQEKKTHSLTRRSFHPSSPRCAVTADHARGPTAKPAGKRHSHLFGAAPAPRP